MYGAIHISWCNKELYHPNLSILNLLTVYSANQKMYQKYEPRNGGLLITKFKMNFPLFALEKRKRPIAVVSKNQHSSSLCSLPRKETNSLFSF